MSDEDEDEDEDEGYVRFTYHTHQAHLTPRAYLDRLLEGFDLGRQLVRMLLIVGDAATSILRSLS